jgi:hypothetical protein
MANPLSLYVPIKQDFLSQAAAQAAYQTFVAQITPGLDKAKLVHYARLILIPNANGQGTQAVLLITTFDGPMNPYLKFFWNTPGFKKTFQGVADLALTAPKPPVTDLTSFELFINNNNLSKPKDLYAAYPQTIEQIDNAFKQKPKAKPPAKAKSKSKAKAKSKSRR